MFTEAVTYSSFAALSVSSYLKACGIACRCGGHDYYYVRYMIYGTYYVCRLIALLDNDAPRGFQIDFNSDLPVLQFDVEWWAPSVRLASSID